MGLAIVCRTQGCVADKKMIGQCGCNCFHKSDEDAIRMLCVYAFLIAFGSSMVSARAEIVRFSIVSEAAREEADRAVLVRARRIALTTIRGIIGAIGSVHGLRDRTNSFHHCSRTQGLSS